MCLRRSRWKAPRGRLLVQCWPQTGFEEVANELGPNRAAGSRLGQEPYSSAYAQTMGCPTISIWQLLFLLQKPQTVDVMASKVRKAVFPAAGLGTRFLPATKAQPKEMLPLV